MEFFDLPFEKMTEDAYNSYRQSQEGLMHNNCPMMDFVDLPATVRYAWLAAIMGAQTVFTRPVHSEQD